MKKGPVITIGMLELMWVFTTVERMNFARRARHSPPHPLRYLIADLKTVKMNHKHNCTSSSCPKLKHFVAIKHPIWNYDIQLCITLKLFETLHLCYNRHINH